MADLYVPVQLNDDLSGFTYFFPFSQRFLLDEGDGYGAIDEFKLFFGLDECGENLTKYVDSGVLGQTIVRGSLNPFFEDFLLDDHFPIEPVVDVRDPSIPCIWHTDTVESFSNEEGQTYKIIHLYFGKMPEDVPLSLMRSDDQGETWFDISASAEVAWRGGTDRGTDWGFNFGLSWDWPRIDVSQMEITSPIMFRLDSPENGSSNIVTINPYDSSDDIGGDRDGGDRIPIPTKYSPEPKPNPEITFTENVDALAADADNVLDAITEISENIPALDTSATSYNSIETKAGTNNPDMNSSSQTPIVQDSQTYPPREWEDENTIAVSGRRLTAMLDANPENIMFIKQGIRLSAPSDALRALELSENQLLRVKVEKLPEYSFSVSFVVDDTQIIDLPLTAYLDEKVFGDLPLMSTVCKNEQGETMLSVYDPAIKQLAVSLPGSGVFTLIRLPDSVVPLSVPENSIMSYKDNAILEERTRSMERLSDMQQTYYPFLQQKIEEAKTARHDLHHHFVMIDGFLNSHQYEKLRSTLLA